MDLLRTVKYESDLRRGRRHLVNCVDGDVHSNSPEGVSEIGVDPMSLKD